MSRKLVDMNITAVAGVDRAANKRTFLIIKRARDPDDKGEEIPNIAKGVTTTADKPSLGKRLLEGIRKMMGMGGMTMDQMMASKEMEDELYDKEWKLGSAFRESVNSIVNDTAMDMEKKKEMLDQSMDQYHTKLMEHMQQVMNLMQQKAGMSESGGTMTNMNKGGPPADPSAVSDPTTRPPDPVNKKEGEVPMTLEDILKALKADERAVVEAALAKSNSVPESVTKRLDELEKTATKVTELEKRAETAEANLAAEIQKRKDAETQFAAEVEKRVAAEMLEKGAKYPHAGTAEQVAAKLRKAYSLSAEFGTEYEADLAKAEAQISKGGLFGERGRSGQAPTGSAESQIEKMAKDRAKADKISYEKAYDLTIQENRDLYKRARTEQEGN